VVRTINGAERLDHLERLRLMANRPDVHVVDGPLPPYERRALIAACDCFLFLHRTEEFGLAMAEAMAFGRPVVATAYGGNLEYMDDE
jgi:glycosyltransferase involved in cell wall biosynthesis